LQSRDIFQVFAESRELADETCMGARRVRLMQITHDLAIGGLQQVVVNLCRTINRDVFDISVLCLRDLGCFVPDVAALGIPVHFLPQKNRGKTDYLSFIKVGRILEEQKIDVIHTHNTQPFVDGTIGALMSGVRTIVHTDHARDFPDKRRYMFAEWVASHFVYKVVGVSDHTSKNLIKYEKISPKKVLTIQNGIDGSRFDIQIDKAKKRCEIGISSSNGPVIGVGVRLTEQKGITYLLRAMPDIVKQFPEVSLVIAGEGPLEAALKQEAHNLGLDRNVLFIGTRLDVPELLKLFDLYVLPSLWEGMPLVLLEAMAAGCPIVATDVGGTSSVVRPDVNGSLVKSKDPSSLAREIIRLLSDIDLRANYALNGLATFQERFSALGMTRQYERLYLRQL
jgi:glycosyltransferase involved in cell wall biosynthesis